MTFGSRPEDWGLAPASKNRPQIEAARKREEQRVKDGVGSSAVDAAIANGQITPSGAVVLHFGPLAGSPRERPDTEPREQEVGDDA